MNQVINTVWGFWVTKPRSLPRPVHRGPNIAGFISFSWCYLVHQHSRDEVKFKMILENNEEPVLDSDVTIIFMEKMEVLLVLMVFIFSLLFVLLILSSIL